MQREGRKKVRCAYWKDLIKIEIATILSIAWFIQMELIRSAQVSPVWTLTQMQKVPNFQQDIIMQASTVYNRVYRDKKSSQFIFSDTGNEQLDGRIGYIDRYSNVRSGYHALLCQQGSSEVEMATPLWVRTENMTATKHFIPREYNKEPKQMECCVGVHDLLPGTNGRMFEVKFRHDVFSYVCKIHEQPERHSNVAYATMTKLMEQKETKEKEEAVKCEQRRNLYKDAMTTFYSTHEPACISPHKRSRTNTIRPVGNREIQVQSFWKAKMEHMQAIINGKGNNESEHLFTYPFVTTDNSLSECLDGLTQLGQHHSPEERDQVLMDGAISYQPTVLVSKSLTTLLPGVDINEDIMDLCLKW